ncbi:MAG TPA: Gfo/Idh/MocA family oxidoreductase [Polyangia bacterium]|jgi:predicted dehydrogenase
MTASDLSVCFLGTGRINARHIGTLRRLRPRATISVASRDPERARAFAARVGAATHFGSYEQALASGAGVVVIGVPPRAHRQLVELALAADKHILVEKPVFAAFAELAAAWPALKAHRRAVMVAENLHYAPFHRRLKALLADGALGRPLVLDLVRLGRSRPTGWRADPAEMPLGALHEGGVHWIRKLLDLAAVFESGQLDHVADVYAVAPSAPVTPTPGEDTTMIVARHRSGLVSRLLHTWAVPWRFPLFDTSKVLLEHGALYFDARGIFGRLYAPAGRSLVWPVVRDAAGYEAMWRDFLAAVEDGRPPELTLDHIFADFAYMDAAYRSLASHRPETPVRSPSV